MLLHQSEGTLFRKTTLDTQQADNFSVIRAQVDAPTNSWEDQLCAHSTNESDLDIVIDFSEVQRIAAQSLAHLVRTQRELKIKGRRLVLACLPSAMTDILNINPLGKELLISPTVEQAVDLLTNDEIESPDTEDS